MLKSVSMQISSDANIRIPLYCAGRTHTQRDLIHTDDNDPKPSLDFFPRGGGPSLSTFWARVRCAIFCGGKCAEVSLVRCAGPEICNQTRANILHYYTTCTRLFFEARDVTPLALRDMFATHYAYLQHKLAWNKNKYVQWAAAAWLGDCYTICGLEDFYIWHLIKQVHLLTTVLDFPGQADSKNIYLVWGI